MSVSAVSSDSKTQSKQVLGLVAGEGSLPGLVAQSATERGFSVVCLAISRIAADAVRPYCTKVYEVFPGQVSKNLKIARAEGIHEVVMIGKVPKLNILQNITKLDWLAIKELSKVTSFGDDSIHQAIGKFLDQEGINVRSQSEFLKHLFPEVGVLTNRQPTVDEYIDIEFGLKTAKELARLDIGQTVVVRDRCVIAVEGSEGTDSAIRRGVELAHKSVVVVKVARPGHDERFDMPAIGLNTLKAMKAGKPGGVLAIGAGETMVVDQEAVIEFADQNGIAIVVV